MLTNRKLTIWRKMETVLCVLTIFFRVVQDLKTEQKIFKNYKQLNRRRNKL